MIYIRLFTGIASNSLFTGKYRKSRILFIVDGILQNAANILTTGVFLSGYIVYLKGSDFLTGILNSSINWASIVALLSFLIFERLKKRKKLLIILNALSRLLICSTVFIPMLVKDDGFVLNLVFIMVVTGNILHALYSTGFMVWLFGILPEESKNEYIYIRTFWLRVAFTLVTVVSGYILDWFNKGFTGFLVVFSLSLFFSILDTVVLINIKEPDYMLTESARPDAAMFLEPIKNKRFRTFIAFVFFFFLSLSMSGSFTPLYLIRYLKFDYSFISSINVIQYLCLISFTGIWKRIESKKGLDYVLKITSLLAITEFLLYSFLTSSTYYLLFLAPIVAGIGYSGFNITLLNYRYSLIPEKNRTVYEGWFGAAFGASTLLAPIVGSFLMKLIPSFNTSIYQHSSFQLLYLASYAAAAAIVFFAFYAPDKVRLLQRAGQVQKQPEM